MWAVCRPTRRRKSSARPWRRVRKRVGSVDQVCDLAGAYEYLSPASRATMPLDLYKAKHKVGMYRAAKVDDSELRSGCLHGEPATHVRLQAREGNHDAVDGKMDHQPRSGMVRGSRTKVGVAKSLQIGMARNADLFEIRASNCNKIRSLLVLK